MTDGSTPYVRDPSRPAMSLELRHVAFTYAGGSTPVIHDLSVDIPAGSLVLIVGSNGGGKSTLLKLLCRLYDPTSGTILVNGRPLTEYKAETFRDAVAALWQDHVRYPLSISENIALGDSARVHDAAGIRVAADRAGCTEFIDALPRGFETSLAKPDVGSGRVRLASSRFGQRPSFMRRKAEEQEREVIFSGGQEQRLALARVLLREEKADLLVRERGVPNTFAC
jgi:ABC-type multidrug transport system fused ATPase/permease subunit